MRIRSNEKIGGSYKAILLVIFIAISVAAFGSKENLKAFLEAIIKPTKEELKTSIKEIIIEDPEFILNAFKQAQVNEMEKIQKEMKLNLQNSKEEIEKSDLTPSIGKQDSDITIVYFFDYNCRYCKQANKVLQKVIAKHHDVKVVYKEFPILGQNSRKIAHTALAIYSVDKDKYPLFHDALLNEEVINDEVVNKVLDSIIIDKIAFDLALKNPKIDEALDKTNSLARKIGIGGTPAFIINDDLIPGMVDEAVIDKKIAELRSAQKNESAEKKDEGVEQKHENPAK
jgi:protein-disulfide isomerase